MDSLVAKVVDKLLELGIPEEILIIVLFLTIGYSLFQKFLKPIAERFDKIPDKDYHEEKNLVENDKRKILLERLESIERSLVEIERGLQEASFNDKILLKETENLNKEIQQIQNILSQLQMRMMYNTPDTFGNREIR